MNLSTALEFGRRAGEHLPENGHIRLVGIEAADILAFGEQLTPAVQAAIPRAVATVLEALDALSASSLYAPTNWFLTLTRTPLGPRRR